MEEAAAGAPAAAAEAAGDGPGGRGLMPPPWGKFSLPASETAYANGHSPGYRQAVREVFGPLVEWVGAWPPGRLAWMMAEVPGRGSLTAFFRDAEERLAPAGSLWVVFPKKPFAEELSFPYSWAEVQRSGLSSGLVDNKIAAFTSRLTSIRFVVPVARRRARASAR